MEEHLMSAASDSPPPPLPWRFFIVAIVVAIAVSAIIAYLGLTGHIGAGVTGEKSPGGGLVFLPLVAVPLLAKVRTKGMDRR
jgi:hypothetical protein